MRLRPLSRDVFPRLMSFGKGRSVCGGPRALKKSISTHSRMAPPQMQRRGDAEKLVRLLQANFPREQISTARPVLEAHGKDESFHPPVEPDAVFFPKSTQDVQMAVSIANEAECCIVGWGAGTSLEGHVAALQVCNIIDFVVELSCEVEVQGGLSIDFGVFMDKVIEVNEADMDCRVQAGITRHALNDQLRHTGLYFPVDPGRRLIINMFEASQDVTMTNVGANCTIGGMASTGASGTAAVKYGTMKENVLGLECVSASGKIFHTGTRARKTSAGYDLTSLLVGSEGTLALMTEVQLKLSGQPETVKSAVCTFPSVEAATETIVTCLQYGVPLARAEMLDPLTMDAINKFSKMDHAVEPTVFFEFHGPPKSVDEQLSIVQEVCASNQARGFTFASSEEERNKLWKARHDAYYAVCALRPGCSGWTTDVCLPISRLGECITETMKDVQDSNIHGPIFGHLGDGNFHVVLLVHPDDEPAYIGRVEAFNDRLVQRALDMGGTCTGEHGVGYAKSGWLEVEHGVEAMEVMKSLKAAMDPLSRLNPGKVFAV